MPPSLAASLLPGLPDNYVVSLVVHNLILAACLLATGYLVARFQVKVNYTRKINHFLLMLIPFVLAIWIPYEPSAATVTLSLVVFVLSTGLLVAPIRNRVPIVAMSFLSIDRPEDRPHTLLWIVTQAIAAYAVLLLVFFALRWLDAPQLIVIPILVNAIGDGMAEPIGVRFGRHKYRVPTLVVGRHYTRSIEGSACVAITALVVVLALAPTLTWPVLIGLLITVPPVMTLTEAFSPHAWDAPLLYAAGGVCVCAASMLG